MTGDLKIQVFVYDVMFVWSERWGRDSGVHQRRTHQDDGRPRWLENLGSIDGLGRRLACGEGVNEPDRTANVEDGSGVEVVMWLTSNVTEACN
ncbi:unnamed protein product [Prunus armeniaca]